MNKAKLLMQFRELLSHFEYHDSFMSELIDILGKSGQEAKFLSVFIKQLNILKKYGHDAIRVDPKNFEHLLKTKNNFYSMHVETAYHNVRILYTFLQNGTVLLLPFHEKNDSRKDSYKNYIPKAERRKTQLEKEKQHEQKKH